eukprot:gnl/MRDRNA2_/MRDRNA2_85770_c0_seq1.p1 gnl/MRDRNA2_/MRDRNA2_85770_c0~~gnl/MRDRNA2_/MRDRNA2_85770_c0_seq1.p1  ORF type:complete len:313 (+),score=46.96 gnl/MRDRNA2_/MRDRNA2_85770_c0_seq1:431-1369(+)
MFDLPLFNALGSDAGACNAGFCGLELSNIAWSCATLQFVHNPLLHSLSAQALRIWNLGQLGTFTSEVKEFGRPDTSGQIGVQALGDMVDSMPVCRPALGFALVEKLVRRLLATYRALRCGAKLDAGSSYVRDLESFGVEATHLGRMGSTITLHALGIPRPPIDAIQWGMDAVVQHRQTGGWWLARRACIMSYHIAVGPGSEASDWTTREELHESGGEAPTDPWLTAVQFKFRRWADRRVCGEAQALEGLCAELLLKDAEPGEIEGPTAAWGAVELFLADAPCVSCIGLLRQFQVSFPGIALQLSVVAVPPPP